MDILNTIKSKAAELSTAKKAVVEAKGKVATIKAEIRAARKAFADALRETPGKTRAPRGPRKPKEAKPSEVTA